MHKFDYSFTQSGKVSVKLFTLAERIAEVRALQAEREAQNPEVFSALESAARVSSVKASNAIEGIVTTDARLEAIVQAGANPRNRDEAEISGYRDALDLIHRNHGELRLSETLILELHRILMRPTGVEGGAYKASDNRIIEEDMEGNRRVRFETVPAKETPEALRQCLLAYEAASQDARTNPLLLIATFILDFLCIHPFKDGNGRISSLLSLFLLYKAGYDASKYVSLEEKIDKTKRSYYQSLEEASVAWQENQNDPSPFIDYFITTLFLCYKDLDELFRSQHGRKVKKTERIEAAVRDSLLPISKREISRLLPDVSVSTIEFVLGEMVRDGRVRKIGRGPATMYEKVE